jgi:hypothetical protein
MDWVGNVQKLKAWVSYELGKERNGYWVSLKKTQQENMRLAVK